MFGNVDASDWLPVKRPIAQSFDDGLNFGNGHSIHRFGSRACGHRSVVAIDFPVGFQVQVWLVQEPVDPFEWQPFSASFVNESEDWCRLFASRVLSSPNSGDTSPALLCQGRTLRDFRLLLLRHVDGFPLLRLLRGVRDRRFLNPQAIPSLRP